MSVAELGFRIDSSGAQGAAVDLDKLAGAAQRAEKAEQSLSGATGRLRDEFGRFVQTSSAAAGAVEGFGTGLTDSIRASGALGGALQRLTGGFTQQKAAAAQALTTIHDLAATQQRLASSSQNVARGEAIAAYGAELDRLRAKFNPVFAASKQYETSLEELNRAHRVGAIGVTEYEAALERLNLEFAAVQTGARSANTALGAMQLSMGQTRAMSRQLMFQLVDIGQAIPLAFQSPVFALQNLGFQMAQIGQLYAGQGGMRAALRDSVQMVGRFAARVGPAAVATGALALAFGGLVSEINETAEVTVTWGDTAKAIIQLVGEAVYDFLEPAINAIAPWFQSAWDLVRTYTKEAGNFIINSIRVAIDAVGTAIGTVPDLFDAAWEGAKSAVLYSLADMTGALQQFLQMAADGLNEVFGTNLGAPTALRDLTTELNRRGSDALQAASAATGRVGAAGADFIDRAAETFASDPLGAAFGAISARAQENARSRLAGSGGGGGGGGAEADREAERRAREAERLQQAYEDLLASGEEFIAQQGIQQQSIGLTEEAAARLQFEFDLMNRALQAGIELTPQQAREIRAMAADMAAAEAETQRMTDAQRQMQEEIEFTNRTATGLFQQMAQEIENGASLWDAFKGAALQALDAVINKVIELIEIQSSGGGKSGGILGGIANLIVTGIGAYAGGGLSGGVTTQASTTAMFGANSGVFNSSTGAIQLPVANGAAFHNGNVIPFANGGIVSRPTLFPMANGAGLMGEAGPEAVMPLRRGANGKLGVEASGGRQAAPVKIEQTNVFQGTQNSDEVRQQIEEANRQLMRDLLRHRELDADFLGAA